MNKWIVTLGVAAVAAALVAVLNQKPGTTPKVFQRPTLDSLINIHGSPEEGLKLCGKSFRRVRGSPPYFLHVTNTSLLLFAYEPFKGTRMLVVCDTNDCSFREIPLGESVFGNQIGDWSPTKGQLGDIVESGSSNRLVLLSKGFRYLERSVLDLESETLRVVEVQSERDKFLLDIWTNPAPKTR